MNIDLGVWGKSDGLPRPYPLVGHLLDAAVLAEALWDGYLTAGQRSLIAEGLGGVDEDHARALVAWWAGLHDLGKAISGFQRLHSAAFAALLTCGYDPMADAQRIGHDVASHLTVPALLAELTDTAQAGVARVAERVGQLLGGHHGVFHRRLRDALDPGRLLARNRGLGGGLWDEQRRALIRGVHAAVGEPAVPSRLEWEAALLITGVVVVADWLASRESFIRKRLNEPGTDDVETWCARHAERSRRDAGRVLRDAGLGGVRWRQVTFEDAFELDAPHPFQRSLLDQLPSLVDGPGLLLVTVPTGLGKTEAALMAARLMGERAGTPGLFLALPTMATADQMYRRVVKYARRCIVDRAGLTLAHSMAWLNEEYAADRTEDVGDVVGDTNGLGGGESSATAAAEWLRGRKRALLAPLSVGTVDQALAAVVKGKHNALRLLGLTGKVLVVDEVHAYDAYMHSLLRRLLQWMGALRVPVVLLSATLSGEIARQLVGDYLLGAGHRGALVPDVPYPGWLYADAVSGKVTPSAVQECEQWNLDVDLHPVRMTNDAGDVQGRLDALRRLLAPVVEDRGCVAVVCNTVADAQQTYRALREWLRKLPDPPELCLLHARFPAWRRAELTSKVEAWFGKDASHRHRRAVLVATQVIEQSLDLDFDLVISDLAPLALLLQRAGRCWRHTARQDRPSWSTGPRLAVLVPTGDTGALRPPRRWLGVYPEAMLMRTEGLLARLTEPIAVPNQVQDLVDEVYAAEFTATDNPDRLRDADLELWGTNAAAQGIAAIASVPNPDGMQSLSEWSAGDVDEELLATRLGADATRFVCCYADEDGDLWLDEARTRKLPERGTGPKGRFTRTDLREIMACTVPVPSGPWTRHLGPEHEVPEPWTRNPLLRHLALLPLRRDDHGDEVAQMGTAIWRLDTEEGLNTA